MKSDQFQVLVCYRLFIDQPHLLLGMRCDCNKKRPAVDAKGHHLITGCARMGNRQITHNALCTEIKNFMGVNGIRSKLEETNCFAFDSKRRPDISIYEGQISDKKIILDVTVTCPVNASCKRKANKGGAAAEVAYKKKIEKYRAIAEQNNLKFTPIVFESTGYMHEDAVELLKDVAGMSDKNKSYTTIALYNYLMTSISVVLQKGLANAFLSNRTRVQGSVVHHEVIQHYSRNTIAEYTEGLHRIGGSSRE